MNIPLPVVAEVYGVSDRSVRRWAARGLLGPVIAKPGHTRRRCVKREAVEARLGLLDNQRLQQAWAEYRCGARQ